MEVAVTDLKMLSQYLHKGNTKSEGIFFLSFLLFESIPLPHGCVPFKNNIYMPDKEPIQEKPGPNQGQITASLDSILVIYFCYIGQVLMTDRSVFGK